MQMLLVRPKEGATILNPDRDNRPLNPAGEKVPLTVYWQRRLRDGDVVATPELRPAPATAPAQTKKAKA